MSREGVHEMRTVLNIGRGLPDRARRRFDGDFNVRTGGSFPARKKPLRALPPIPLLTARVDRDDALDLAE